MIKLKKIRSIFFQIYYGMARTIKRRVRLMVLNATFNNISAISWRSVLLVEETGVTGENHRPAASHWQTLSHNAVSSTSGHERNQTRIYLI